MRLLTAVVLNLPVKGLPFDPGVRIEEAAVSLHLLPFTGRLGYKAQYYTPENYRALLDYCGLDGLHAAVESGRDAINHVVAARPRPLPAQPETLAR